MEELQVTRYWMLGVVATMLVFGVIALAGYIRLRRKGSSSEIRH
jgi:hypothetical protein